MVSADPLNIKPLISELPSEILERLDALGVLRAGLNRADDTIVKEIKKTLVRAKREGVSKSEAARRLKVARTTVYRVYDG